MKTSNFANDYKSDATPFFDWRIAAGAGARPRIAACQIFEERRAKLRFQKGELNIGFEVAKAVAGVVVMSLKTQPGEWFSAAKDIQSVRELNFARANRIVLAIESQMAGSRR